MGALQKALPTGKLYEKIDNFSGGINSTEEDTALLDNTFRDLINWDLNDVGSLKKRMGSKVEYDAIKDILPYLISKGLLTEGATIDQVISGDLNTNFQGIGMYNNSYIDNESGNVFIFFNNFAWDFRTKRQMNFYNYSLGEGTNQINPKVIADNQELPIKYYNLMDSLSLGSKCTFQIIGEQKVNIYVITDHGTFVYRENDWYLITPYVPSIGTYKTNFGNLLAKGYKTIDDGKWGIFWNWDWINQTILWAAPVSTPVAILPKEIVSDIPNSFRLVIADSNSNSNSRQVAVWRLKYADSEKFYLLKRSSVDGGGNQAFPSIQIDGISGVDSDTAILEALLTDDKETDIVVNEPNLLYEGGSSFWANIATYQESGEDLRGVDSGGFCIPDIESSKSYWYTNVSFKDDTDIRYAQSLPILKNLNGYSSSSVITAFGSDPFTHTNWQQDLTIPNTNVYGSATDMRAYNKIFPDFEGPGSSIFLMNGVSPLVEHSIMLGLNLKISDSLKDLILNPGETQDLSVFRVSLPYTNQLAHFKQYLNRARRSKGDLRINTSTMAYLCFAQGTIFAKPSKDKNTTLGELIKNYKTLHSPGYLNLWADGEESNIIPTGQHYAYTPQIYTDILFGEFKIYTGGDNDRKSFLNYNNIYNEGKGTKYQRDVFDKVISALSTFNKNGSLGCLYGNNRIPVNNIVFPYKKDVALKWTVPGLQGLHPNAPQYWRTLQVNSTDTTYHNNLIESIAPGIIPGAEKAIVKLTSGTKSYNDTLNQSIYISRGSNNMVDLWSGDDYSLNINLIQQIQNFKSWLNQALSEYITAGGSEADFYKEIDSYKLALNINILITVGTNDYTGNGLDYNAALTQPFGLRFEEVYANGVSILVNGWKGSTIAYVPDGGLRGTQLINAPDSYSLQQSLKSLGDLSRLLPNPENLKEITSSNSSTLYNNQLMVWNDKKNIMFYSQPNTFNYFPLLNTFQATNSEQEQISNLVPFNSMALLFTKDSIYGLTGDYVADYKIKTLNNNVGALAPRATVSIDNKVYFIARNGAYSASYVFGLDGGIKVERLDHPIERMYRPDENMVGVSYRGKWIILDQNNNFIYTYNPGDRRTPAWWARDKIELSGGDQVIDIKVVRENLYFITLAGKILRKYNEYDYNEVQNSISTNENKTHHFLLTRLFYDAFDENTYFNKNGSDSINDWSLRTDANPENDDTLFNYIQYQDDPSKHVPISFNREHMINNSLGAPINSILLTKTYGGLGNAYHNPKKWKEVQVKLTQTSIDRTAYVGLIINGNPALWPYSVAVLKDKSTGEITVQQELVDKITEENFVGKTILYGTYNLSQPSKSLLSFNKGSYLDDTFVLGGRGLNNQQYLAGTTGSVLGDSSQYNYRIKQGKKGYGEQIYIENGNDLPFGINSILLVYKFKRPK